MRMMVPDTSLDGQTRLLRELCDRRGIPYEEGYVVGDRRICAGFATHVRAGGRTLTFEGDEGGLTCADPLTPEECLGLATGPARYVEVPLDSEMVPIRPGDVMVRRDGLWGEMVVYGLVWSPLHGCVPLARSTSDDSTHSLRLSDVVHAPSPEGDGGDAA